MATKNKAAAKPRVRTHATRTATIPVEQPTEQTTAPVETETHLHQHPDANNFGASHDESEARKEAKRRDNGYSGH